MKSTVLKVVFSVVVFAVAGVFEKIWYHGAPLLQGKLAAGQMESSDLNYMESSLAIQGLSNDNPWIARGIGIFILCGLLLIWLPGIIKYLKKTFAKVDPPSTFTAVALVLLCASQSFAFYDTRDLPEYVEIQPNQTAFFIPMVGDNKTSQKKFMSESFLNDNKVGSKRIQVPHAKIHNPGMKADYFVPSAKLLIVDRTNYAREWAKGAEKGTSKTNEAIETESRDSVNIDFDIAVAAFIKEEDAAKYLYYYGTTGVADPNNPDSNYASVSNARPLSEVMDNVVRRKVLGMFAVEFGKYNFMDAINHKPEIIGSVSKQITEQCAQQGITITNLGFSSALRFDESIQKSIDSVVTTNIRFSVLDKDLKLLQLDKARAEIAMRNGLATSFAKWNGQLPWYLPSEMIKTLTGWFEKMFASAK